MRTVSDITFDHLIQKQIDLIADQLQKPWHDFYPEKREIRYHIMNARISIRLKNKISNKSLKAGKFTKLVTQRGRMLL